MADNQALAFLVANLVNVVDIQIVNLLGRIAGKRDADDLALEHAFAVIRANGHHRFLPQI